MKIYMDHLYGLNIIILYHHIVFLLHNTTTEWYVVKHFQIDTWVLNKG